MDHNALILLHPGFEELEAVAVIDLLARSGVEVTQANLGDVREVPGRNGITLVADCLAENLPEEPIYDVIILPGGPGIQKIRRDARVCRLLRRQHDAGRLVACICAGPLLLLDAGLLDQGLRYTSFPATASELPERSDAKVVLDRQILTSQGAGTATEFALAIIDSLQGADRAKTIAESICWTQG